MSKQWFVRKSYGYGWTPSTSQGWMLVLLFMMMQVLIGALTFTYISDIQAQLTAYMGFTLVNVYVLIRITIAHAPTAQWQWSGSTKPSTPTKKVSTKSKKK